ncbi:MAG: DUF948 domain-containing protein [Blastocatellia bacterium]|nr:DUF948 domain-containing protein [Blastocatellia bacterium]MBL8192700.1 DUF948 domain-containing protein [Blastocatellia bacterium]MBN8723639.1 DUF948 domain-containing protein [Acidobacteriota bacterium]
MKSSSASFLAIAVVLLGLVTTGLIFSNGIAYALLVVTITVGLASALFAVQNVLNQIEELRQDIAMLQKEATRNFSSLANSTKDLKLDFSSKASEIISSAVANISTQPTNSGVISLPLSTNPEPTFTPVATRKESFTQTPAKEISSPMLNNPSFQPVQNTTNLNLDDPNRTNASVAPKSTITSPNQAVSHTSSHDMESTQSFLPSSSSISQAPWTAPNNNPPVETSENLSPDATLGFASSPIPPVDLNRVNEYLEQPKTPSKTHGKIKKRYSTFAGLSLNESGQDLNQYKEDLLTPPPAPPPPSQLKKKRYSTFAGLSLTEPPKVAENLAKNSIAPYPAASKAATPSTVTNLGFSKNTEATGVSQEDLINEQANINMPVPKPSPTKGVRKRYQTFMGLSLSKTPQPMKRFEEPAFMDATAPLSTSVPSAASFKAPAPSAMQAAINRGQQGNLVDGFCSLCGSPQAAANDYASSGSEPEFCWYCGAKLRN